MAKEKSLTELRAEKAEIVKRAYALTDNARKKDRRLNDEEMKEHNEINLRVAELNTQIASHEAINRVGRGVPYNQTRSNPDTPLLSVFREIARGEVSEESRSLMLEGSGEMERSGVSIKQGYNIPVESRALTAGVNTQVIATEKQTILDPLRNELVFGKLGATFMPGMVGNIEIPSYSGSNSHWKGETAKAEDGAGIFDSKTFSPKRLTTMLDVSMQFLIQDSVSAEEMLRRDLTNSIREKLEATAFGTGAEGDAPAGLLGTVKYTGVDDHVGIVKMIRDVKQANALKGGGFVTNAEGEAKLITTPIDAANPYGFLSTGEKILNYPLEVSEGVANVGDEAGAIFANWSDFVVLQWGALNITVDNITQAREGVVRFIINSFWDYGFRRDESFVTASIPLIQ